MLTLALILCFVCGLVYYFRHRVTYWQRHGVPTPGLGYQWHYYRRELAPYDMELVQRYGPVYGVMETLKPNLIVSDPDLIRDLLVRDFSSFPNHKPFRMGDKTIDLSIFALDGNDDWRRIRSMLSPTFTSGKLRSMEATVNACVGTLLRNLGDAAAKGDAIDAKRFFSSLSFDVILRCACGTQIESLNDPTNPVFKNFEKLFSGQWELVVAILFPKFSAWTGIKDRALKPFNFFLQMTRALIKERQSQSEGGAAVHHDFLQAMLDANQELATEGASSTKKTVTTDEMVAQVLTFLIAGFDTTATILACTAYHLARHPSVQKRLIEEVSALRPEDYTHDGVNSLPFLEAVLKESFRLSPPAIRVERECALPTLLGGVKVEPGTVITVPVYAVHRNPTQYPNPDQFKPERFLAGGESANHHPYAHLPFGGGPRMCVAQRFALMEVKLALVQVMKEFRFEATPETKMSFIPSSFDLLAPNPIMVKIKQN